MTRGRCLVTGAGGWVGGAVLGRMGESARPAVGAVRRPPVPSEARGGSLVAAPSLDDPAADWRHALAGCDTVLHAAARVHVMHETAADASAAFRAVNVDGTMRLARQAADAGVKRFVFVSSIKVNGECTPVGRAFRADDAPAPVDPYGRSKAEAEEALRTLSSRTGMAVVVVRPPLVHGPGVKGNFLEMLKWLDRGVPLPLAGLDNRRSLVALDTLVDLLALALVHPAAPGQTFLASDDEDLSTPSMLRRLASAMGRRARLFRLPVGVLRGLAAAAGRTAAFDRLAGDLRVDVTHTRRVLGWSPSVSVDEAFARTAAWFAASGRRA